MYRPLYAKLGALRSGEIVDIDGVQITAIDGKEYGGDLEVGDTYYACRNTEQLLTVKKVDRDLGCVFPVEVAYPFDLRECIGVELVEEEGMVKA